MIADIIIVVLVIAAWRVSLRRWPYAPCRKCRGQGWNAGSNSRRYGTCGQCGGSSSRLRFGARRPGS